MINEKSEAVAPVAWECGCGWTNGVNRANCAQCWRPPHDLPDWGPNTTRLVYAASALDSLREENAALRKERDLAVAHDRQPYPTAWAYEQSCKALEAQRQRAEAAEAALLSIVSQHQSGSVITEAHWNAARAALQGAKP